MPYLNQIEMIKAEAKYYAKENGQFGELFYIFLSCCYFFISCTQTSALS